MKAFAWSLPLLTAVSLLLAPLPGLAQDDVEVNSVLKAFDIDLDGDGSKESIELQVASTDENGHSDQLRVRTADGELIWQSPLYEPGSGFNPKEPVFGAWPFGISDISVVTDLGDDGVVDLLARAPQSDVRPTSWRLFRWEENAFVIFGIGRLIETQSGSGQFDFLPQDADGTTWVNELKLDGKNFLAEIYALQANGDMHVGQAQLALNNDGMKVLKWVKKPVKAW